MTTPFVHDSLGYQFVTLLAVGIFGSLIERRFGWFCVLFVFLAAGAAGAAAAVAADLGAAVRGLPHLRGARRQRSGAGPAGRLVRGRPPRRAARATIARATCWACT